jgi:WD repeat and SOF domain-containing protein 1
MLSSGRDGHAKLWEVLGD